MHADRTNRALLGLLGLLLLAAGVAGILAGTSAFGAGGPHRHLLDNAASRYIGAHSAWFWPAAALLAAIAVLLAVRWLLVILFTTDRLADLTLPGDRSAGRTTLAAGAVTDALTQEIETYRGVRAAHARMVGHPGRPRLAVTVDTDHDADLAALRRRIESGALAHARQATDAPDLPSRLDFTITTRRAARVN